MKNLARPKRTLTQSSSVMLLISKQNVISSFEKETGDDGMRRRKNIWSVVSMLSSQNVQILSSKLKRTLDNSLDG